MFPDPQLISYSSLFLQRQPQHFGEKPKEDIGIDQSDDKQHLDVMSLILLSYLIILNYFIYRSAPRNPRHTLPQGFFIQVFTAIAFLVFNMFDDLTSWHWFSFVLGNVWTYAVYKQFFGYGVWGTLWRVVLALVCAHLLALLFLGIDFIYHLIQTGDYNFVDGFKLFLKLLNRMLTNSDV